MDVNSVLPFLDAVKYTLEQFGINDIKRGTIKKKSSLCIDLGINSVIGVVGSIKGKVAYSMTECTAKKIVSVMMMGMPVEVIDDMGKSAIGELANMITGQASATLSSNGYDINITPPVVIINDESASIVSNVETITVDIETPLGKVEVNIGFEQN
jgi:chemotaxis protein CheX